MIWLCITLQYYCIFTIYLEREICRCIRFACIDMIWLCISLQFCIFTIYLERVWRGRINITESTFTNGVQWNSLILQIRYICIALEWIALENSGRCNCITTIEPKPKIFALRYNWISITLCCHKSATDFGLLSGRTGFNFRFCSFENWMDPSAHLPIG